MSLDYARTNLRAAIEEMIDVLTEIQNGPGGDLDAARDGCIIVLGQIRAAVEAISEAEMAGPAKAVSP